MKPCRLFVATISALAIAGGSLARGQEALPAQPAVPDVEEVFTRADQEQAEQSAVLAEQIARAQEKLALTQVNQDILLAQAAGAAQVAVAQPAIQQRLHSVVSRGRTGAGKTLVIRSSDADPKSQADLEEDLAVMARVLEKAIDEKLDDEPRARKAMGIDVFMTPGSSPMRSLYLEGYGALFLLNVRFPLLAPPEKTEEVKERTETDSTWEEARREVYGQPSPGGHFDHALKAYGEFVRSVPEYDEENVQKLKDAVLEALKNATNIRNLKSDETITVCVFGGSQPARAATVRRRATAAAKSGDRSSEDPNVVIWAGDDSARSRGTIMTIRAKKSDVDAFAKGRLDADGFRKKASVVTYASDTGGWGGGNPWFELVR